MAYLLTVTSELGDVADVDVDLEELDLDSAEGQRALARAVQAALAELEEVDMRARVGGL